MPAATASATATTAMRLNPKHIDTITFRTLGGQPNRQGGSVWRAYVDESELLHIVVVRYGPIGESSERSRRKCFQRLAFELDGHGVVVIAAEAREVKANKRDLQLFNQLRASRQIGHDMRLNHVPGPDEPLLWIADVVAGVVGARIRGVDECYKPLIDDIQVIRIDTKP